MRISCWRLNCCLGALVFAAASWTAEAFSAAEEAEALAEATKYEVKKRFDVDLSKKSFWGLDANVPIERHYIAVYPARESSYDESYPYWEEPSVHVPRYQDEPIIQFQDPLEKRFTLVKRSARAALSSLEAASRQEEEHEQKKRFDPFDKRFDPYRKRFYPFSKRFDPYSKRFDPYSKRFDPYSKRFDPYSKRFDPYSKRFDPFDKRFDPEFSSLSRLGKRFDYFFGNRNRRFDLDMHVRPPISSLDTRAYFVKFG